MHKIELFALLFAVCLLSAATAKPIDEKEPNDDETILLRQKRVTCDLLSFQAKGFSANHSICAAHCIALRKKGGRCINGVCNCRN